MNRAEQIALQEAIINEDLESFRYLLNNTNPLEGECTINDAIISQDLMGGEFKYYLLSSAASNYIRQSPEFVQILLAKGADPNVIHKYGSSFFLTYNYTSMELLLRAGLDVNIKDTNGCSLLYSLISCHRYFIDIMDTLLEMGADPSAVNTSITDIAGNNLEKHFYSFTILYHTLELEKNSVDKLTPGQQERYSITKKLIKAGANVNHESISYTIKVDGSIDEKSISRQTPLYQALEYAAEKSDEGAIEHISLVLDLLKAGADPSIPTSNSDTSFKLVIRSKNLQLIDSICSVLFEQDSLMSLYSITVLTLESLRLNNEIDPTLLEYYKKGILQPNLDMKLLKYVDQFKGEISKVEGKGKVQEVFKNFVSIPKKFHKSLKTIQEKFPNKLSVLPEQLFESFLKDLHDALSSITIRYSQEYSKSFLSDKEVIPTDPSKSNIVGDAKAHVISFLPIEKQWKATMLSKSGLEDPWFPKQPVIDFDADCEQGIIGIQIPNYCNIM